MKKSEIPKLDQNIGLGKLLLVRLDFYFTCTATESAKISFHRLKTI